MERDCFFTSIALNYLPKALALAESVFAVYPSTRFVISMADIALLSELQRSALAGIANRFAAHGRTLQFMDPLPLYERPDLLVFKFNVVELCTCVKPAVAMHLLESADTVTYLDPDIILYTELPTETAGPTGDWSIEVTPHALAPTQPNGAISERLFLYYGVFNLGYFAVRQHNQALAFLRWWKDFCLHYGADAPQTGLFVDQKPVDLLPCFVDRVHIIRHPGCNVAWWNMFADGRWLSTPRTIQFQGMDVPLVFFHFSNLHRPSDGQPRRIAVSLPPPKQAHEQGLPGVLISDHGPVSDLFAEYDRLTGAFDELCRTVGHPAGTRRAPPLTLRLLLAEALRRGMPFKEDPSKVGNWKVFCACMAYLLRRTSWSDAKLILGANLRYAKLSLSSRLLRHHP